MSVGALGWLQNTIRMDVTGEWARIIHVSVGGSLFTVSRSVFKLYEEHPFFGKLCDDSMRKDSDGCTVVDRDGSMFRHVLNFIRSEKAAHDALAEQEEQERKAASAATTAAGGGGPTPPPPPPPQIPPVLGKLLLPDHFDEWDLLLEEVAYYQLPSMQQAIVNDERYKMRMWKRSLPTAVYVMWKETTPPAASTSSSSKQPTLQISMIPELPFLQIVEQPQSGNGAADRSIANGLDTSNALDTSTTTPESPAAAAAASPTTPPSQCVMYQGSHPIMNVHELTYYLLNVFDLKVNHWKTENSNTNSGSGVEHHLHFVRSTPLIVKGGE